VPTTLILFYQEKEGDAPVVDWLNDLLNKNPKAFANCVGRIRQLQSMGYELRRPSADYLRDGIYELRAKHRTGQYRILYFFCGKDIAVLGHSIVKKTADVPNKDIELAIDRKQKFDLNPSQHTYQGEVADNG
jgi:phage-related protein